MLSFFFLYRKQTTVLREHFVSEHCFIQGSICPLNALIAHEIYEHVSFILFSSLIIVDAPIHLYYNTTERGCLHGAM